jgi:hypothetical protein
MYRIYYDPLVGPGHERYSLSLSGSLRDMEPIKHKLRNGLRVMLYTDGLPDTVAVLQYDSVWGWTGVTANKAPLLSRIISLPYVFFAVVFGGIGGAYQAPLLALVPFVLGLAIYRTWRVRFIGRTWRDLAWTFVPLLAVGLIAALGAALIIQSIHPTIERT